MTQDNFALAQIGADITKPRHKPIGLRPPTHWSRAATTKQRRPIWDQNINLHTKNVLWCRHTEVPTRDVATACAASRTRGCGCGIRLSGGLTRPTSSSSADTATAPRLADGRAAL